jgi:hypothetical protein
LRFAGFCFESVMISKSVEICRFFLYSVGLFRVGVDCLKVNCELELICLGLHSTVTHQVLACRAVFWTLMDRSLLIRERELEASGIFMGRVDGLWWSGGLGVSF